MVTKVTLHDGREVDSMSAEWRAECEACHLLDMPTKEERRQYLAGVGRHRGPNGRARLEILALKVHEARKRSSGQTG